MSVARIKDIEMLKWLHQCDKIDRSAVGGGWAFEKLHVPEEGGPPIDVRLAVRDEGNLITAIDAAIKAERNMAEIIEGGE